MYIQIHVHVYASSACTCMHKGVHIRVTVYSAPQKSVELENDADGDLKPVQLGVAFRSYIYMYVATSLVGVPRLSAYLILDNPFGRQTEIVLQLIALYTYAVHW